MAVLEYYLAVAKNKDLAIKAWEKCNATAIDCQSVANNVVDWYIADGKVAIKTICRILGINSSIIGSYVIGQLNKLNNRALVEAIHYERLMYHYNKSVSFKEALKQHFVLLS